MGNATKPIPPTLWPEDLRQRFDRHPLTKAQLARLRPGLGRWLSVSSSMGLDARDVSRATWLERTSGMRPARRNAVRQALAIAFPAAASGLYAGDHERATRKDPRADLAVSIRRALARFPPPWRDVAEPLLHVDPAAVGDGILIQAWAPSTIIRRLESAARHFDYCRVQGVDVGIIPDTIRSRLRQEQARVERGERRIAGLLIEIEGLAGLAPVLFPETNWTWLRTTRDRLKKLAKGHGSHNAARAVDAAELRVAGQQLLQKADAAHAAARNRREFVKAHTTARTALTMILLSEAPIRISSCAQLELAGGLLSDLSGLFLDPANTKEGETDRRAFSATLIDAITRYVSLHRKVVAAPGETRLFVGDKGGPVLGSQLSKCLGDFTEGTFSVRVTSHPVRHSVGNFIVANAPEEAALATVILNHRSDSVTPVYLQKADQIKASRLLAAATEQSALELSADTTPTRRKTKPGKERQPRRRGRPERAVRARHK